MLRMGCNISSISKLHAQSDGTGAQQRSAIPHHKVGDTILENADWSVGKKPLMVRYLDDKLEAKTVNPSHKLFTTDINYPSTAK